MYVFCFPDGNRKFAAGACSCGYTCTVRCYASLPAVILQGLASTQDLCPGWSLLSLLQGLDDWISPPLLNAHVLWVLLHLAVRVPCLEYLVEATWGPELPCLQGWGKGAKCIWNKTSQKIHFWDHCWRSDQIGSLAGCRAIWGLKEGLGPLREKQRLKARPQSYPYCEGFHHKANPQELQFMAETFGASWASAGIASDSEKLKKNRTFDYARDWQDAREKRRSRSGSPHSCLPALWMRPELVGINLT